MRKKRPIHRETGVLRDASLIVIASEDRYAVQQYFDLLQSPRIKFRVLSAEDGESSPQHVLSRLDQFRLEFDLDGKDKLWFVCDADHWAESDHISNLTRIRQECRTKEIGFAMASPCFELWLLLHFEAVARGERLTCTEAENRLKNTVGNYSKKRIFDLPIDIGRIRSAIERSEALGGKEGGIPLGHFGTNLVLSLASLRIKTNFDHQVDWLSCLGAFAILDRCVEHGRVAWRWRQERSARQGDLENGIRWGIEKPSVAKLRGRGLSLMGVPGFEPGTSTMSTPRQPRNNQPKSQSHHQIHKRPKQSRNSNLAASAVSISDYFHHHTQPQKNHQIPPVTIWFNGILVELLMQFTGENGEKLATNLKCMPM